MKTLVKIMTAATLLSICMPQLLAGSSTPGETAAPSKPAPEAAKESAANQPAPSPSRAAREEKALQDARRQQLAEKEAALTVKEQELQKLSAKLDAQLKALEESKKQLDGLQKSQAAAQKKVVDEKVAKMVKLFKTMRGEQAGKLIDGMQEDLAMGLLSRLDTKTVAKLVPFINQPRILKWVSENLRGR